MTDSDRDEVDFVRFYGVRIVDADTDERKPTIFYGEENLNLPASASLLAISNRFGILFFGVSDGFRWGSLEELRAACTEAGNATDPASVFHHVASSGERVHMLAINADDSKLALVHADGSVTIFDVPSVIHGRDTPASITPFAPPLRHWQWSPTRPSTALMLGANGSLRIVEMDGNGGLGTLCEVAMDAQLATASWGLDGTTLLCGMLDGRLVRFVAEGAPGSVPSKWSQAEQLSGQPDGVSGASLRLVRPITERHTLLCYHRDDEEDPYVAVYDGTAQQLDQCDSAFFPDGREPLDGGDPEPTNFYAVAVPEWRMAIVTSSHSDQVVSFGSRKKDQPRCARVLCACRVHAMLSPVRAVIDAGPPSRHPRCSVAGT